MSLTPTQKTPPAPLPQVTPPNPASVKPAAKNDGDGDDGGGAVRASLDKGVGELLDKSA